MLNDDSEDDKEQLHDEDHIDDDAKVLKEGVEANLLFDLKRMQRKE